MDVEVGVCEGLDLLRAPLGGGSCSTGGGGVCSFAEDFSLGVGGADGALGAEAAGAELRGRVLLGDDWEELLADELESVLPLGAVGGVRPQSCLPLEAVLSGLWQ